MPTNLDLWLGHLDRRLEAIEREMKRMATAFDTLAAQAAQNMTTETAAAAEIKDLKAKLADAQAQLATAQANAVDPAAVANLAQQLATSQQALASA